MMVLLFCANYNSYLVTVSTNTIVTHNWSLLQVCLTVSLESTF